MICSANLQSVSTLLGETVAGNSDLRSASSKKSDEASASLSDLANPTSEAESFSTYQPLVLTMSAEGASTTEGTKISGRQQVENMSSGSADHLDLAFRKEE